METDQSGLNQRDTPDLATIEQLVRSLAGIMRDGGVTELDLAFGTVSVRLRSPGLAAPSANTGPAAPAVVAEELAPLPDEVITAPMIGTFYASPSPSERPFVDVGDKIKSGQVVGIIEAMKIMNEITADRAGVVSAILVSNAQPVEYGSPLMRIIPDGIEP